MDWLTLSIFSAITLGLYEISRKKALQRASAIPVLLFSTALSGILMLPTLLSAPSITVEQHLWILLKSFIICFSWGAEFFALQAIPLSLGMAVRSCGPLLTTIMAVTFFREMPTKIEWIGIALVLVGYFQFASIARFHKKQGDIKYRWLAVMLGATILGTVSGGIDRFLLKSTTILPSTLQAWFSIYTPLLLAPWAILLYVKDKNRTDPLTYAQWWSWAIPFIAILLLISDRLYFSALAMHDSTLAVVGAMRRGSLIISVIGGGFLLGEKRMREKINAILLVFVGLVLLRLFGG